MPVASYVLVLPITGAVQAGLAPEALTLIEVEQVYLLALPAASTLHLQNPYPADTIRFLHLWLAAPAETPAAQQLLSFHFADLAGQLAPVVLAGAFEVEGRLLHAHDGLALWDTATVELEALSPDALVLVVELAA